jgi:DNA-binding MarR family transcriptional regulator
LSAWHLSETPGVRASASLAVDHNHGDQYCLWFVSIVDMPLSKDDFSIGATKTELVRLMENRDVVGFIDRAMQRTVAELPELDDTANRLILLILRVGTLISYDHESSIQRPLGLTSAGFHLMWVIWLAGPLEGSVAAILMGASRASVSGLSATLEKEGMIRKSPSESDGRSTLLSLTEEGRERFQRAWLEIDKSGRSVISALSGAEAQTLIALLSKVAGIAAANLRQRS